MSFVRYLQQRRARLLFVPIIIFLIYALLIRDDLWQEIFSLKHNTRPVSSPEPVPESLPLPPEYDPAPLRGTICQERFSGDYIEEFRDHSVSYCSSQSKADLTCFHTHKRSDGGTDSLCFGRGVSFDLERGKFSLECAIRTLEEDEKQRGLVPFKSIQGYWYETGPPEVFSRGVDIHEPQLLVARIEEEADSKNFDEVERVEDVSPEIKTDITSSDILDNQPGSPRNFLLLKREGEGNLWHCMMEIFSSWMTFDVLRISKTPTGDPFFLAPEDIWDTQVIILDERLDGPYFDLWTLFARRKPMRLRELANNPEMAAAIRNANIIVPLAGSSNPLWQEDWEPDQCASMPTISVFSNRVLEFYQVPEPNQHKADDPITVTFIDRTSSRRLLNQTIIFDLLKARIPHISLQVVDFAAISFPEQLRIIRGTDVLVGVHGAGFTHALFMREYAGAVVEIQPHELDYHVFRNIALLRGLRYFRIHAESIPNEDGNKKRRPKRRDWHWHNIKIEADRFVDIVDVAVKSLYANGLWDYDVVR